MRVFPEISQARAGELRDEARAQLREGIDPASQRKLDKLAGHTTLRATSTTWARENVWLDAGGSPSSVFKAQPWQAPPTYGAFAGARGPDVPFDGNPASGELVLLGGRYYQVGGTSLSAPLFAGAWARILQGNPGLGFAAPHLYTLPASAFHDVRAGNNGGYIRAAGLGLGHGPWQPGRQGSRGRTVGGLAFPQMSVRTCKHLAATPGAVFRGAWRQRFRCGAVAVG